MREVIIVRLRDLLTYLEQHEHPDWRSTAVELEAIARSLQRMAADGRTE